MCSPTDISPLGVAVKQDQVSITGFGRPFGLKVMQDGMTYVTDMDLHAIFEVSSDMSTYRVLIGPEGWSAPIPFVSGFRQQAPARRPGHFNGPHSFDVSSDGEVCITTYYTPALHLFGANGKPERVVQRLTAGTTLTGPATAMYTSGGALLVTEYTQNAVFRWHPRSNLMTSVAHSIDGVVVLDRPHMARQLSCGTVLIVDTWNHRLVRVAPNGSLAGWWGALTDHDHLGGWHHAMNYGIASQHVGGLRAPVAVDVHPLSGYLLVTDWGNDRLLLLNPGGQLVTTLASFNLKKPYDARFYQQGFAIADSHNGRVLFVNSLEFY